MKKEVPIGRVEVFNHEFSSLQEYLGMNTTEVLVISPKVVVFPATKTEEVTVISQ